MRHQITQSEPADGMAENAKKPLRLTGQRGLNFADDVRQRRRKPAENGQKSWLSVLRKIIAYSFWSVIGFLLTERLHSTFIQEPSPVLKRE
jgi:hypothetical protein